MGGRLGPELGHVFLMKGGCSCTFGPWVGMSLTYSIKNKESCCSWNRMKEGVSRLENGKIRGQKVGRDGLYMAFEA